MIWEDMERTQFPWVSHFTQSEVFTMEALRLRYSDHQIIQIKRESGGKIMPYKSFGDVLGYIRRNPVPVGEAA